jgi:hypothetical protein
MLLLEGSDTQLKFHITQTEDWNTTDVDLSEYEKIILTIKYNTWIVEYEWVVDSEQTSYVIFDILSDDTNWKKWNITCDIWWISWWQKNRFNDETIKWKVLPSIKVPNEV